MVGLDSLVEWFGAAPMAPTPSESPALFDPITAVVVLVLVGIVVVLVLVNRRRGIDMAQKYGWAPMQFARRDPASGWVVENSAFLNGRRVNATTGPWRQWTAERFRWFENDQPVIGSQTWIDCIRLPGALPLIALRPIKGTRRGNPASIVDRDALRAEFRRRWYVHDPGGWANGIVSESLVRVLLADDAPRIPVTIAGDALFTHRKTTWRRADLGLEGRFDFLVRIAETIPRSTYQAVGANASAAAAAQAALHPFLDERPLVAAQTKRNVLGTASIALAATLLLSPIGFVLGVLGLRASQRGLATNRDLAITGIVLNIAVIVLVALMIVVEVSR